MLVKDDSVTDLYAHWSSFKYKVLFNANKNDNIKIGSVITGKGVEVNAKPGQIYD